jgi:hypothetical protein
LGVEDERALGTSGGVAGDAPRTIAGHPRSTTKYDVHRVPNRVIGPVQQQSCDDVQASGVSSPDVDLSDASQSMVGRIDIRCPWRQRGRGRRRRLDGGVRELETAGLGFDLARIIQSKPRRIHRPEPRGLRSWRRCPRPVTA